MGLGSTIGTAVNGLKVSQTILGGAAQNIANAATPGYTRKATTASAVYDGAGGMTGVRTRTTNVALSTSLQNYFRSSNARFQSAEITADFANRLDRLFGRIDDSGRLPAMLSQLQTTLDNLVTTPQDQASRLATVRAAGQLAARLNSMSGEIQKMRSDADTRIGDAVEAINGLLRDIAQADRTIIASGAAENQLALADHRNMLVDRLSGYFDINVLAGRSGAIKIMTTSGATLYDVTPVRLDFNSSGSLSANSRYNTDPDKSTAATITLTGSSGDELDMIGNRLFSGGSLGTLVGLRDSRLNQAQDQLDEIAANIARAFQTHRVLGESAPGAGIDLDPARLREGDALTFSWRDSASGAKRAVTIFRNDNGAELSIERSTDPRHTYVSADFSSADTDDIIDSITAALEASPAIGKGRFTVAARSDGKLRFAPVTASASPIEGGYASVSVPDLVGTADALPLFVEPSGTLYTPIADGRAAQTGFAARITVNQQIKARPELLVRYTNNVATGDPLRPDLLAKKLAAGDYTFMRAGSAPGSAAPATMKIADAISTIVSRTGAQAAEAKIQAESSKIEFSNLQARITKETGVDIDRELAILIEMQSAYSANARVMQVTRELFDTLLRS